MMRDPSRYIGRLVRSASRFATRSGTGARGAPRAARVMDGEVDPIASPGDSWRWPRRRRHGLLGGGFCGRWRGRGVFPDQIEVPALDDTATAAVVAFEHVDVPEPALLVLLDLGLGPRRNHARRERLDVAESDLSALGGGGDALPDHGLSV